MPAQARATHRKPWWSTQPSSGTLPQPYRRRRPETTTLHRIVGEHMETFLALANESDPMGDGLSDHVEKEFSGSSPSPNVSGPSSTTVPEPPRPSSISCSGPFRLP